MTGGNTADSKQEPIVITLNLMDGLQSRLQFGFQQSPHIVTNSRFWVDERLLRMSYSVQTKSGSIMILRRSGTRIQSLT